MTKYATTRSLANQERAFTAASRRPDRSLEGRLASGHAASGLHHRRTGRRLHITTDTILRGETYDEVDDLSWRRRHRQPLECPTDVSPIQATYHNQDLSQAGEASQQRQQQQQQHPQEQLPDADSSTLSMTMQQQKRDWDMFADLIEPSAYSCPTVGPGPNPTSPFFLSCGDSTTTTAPSTADHLSIQSPSTPPSQCLVDPALQQQQQQQQQHGKPSNLDPHDAQQARVSGDVATTLMMMGLGDMGAAPSPEEKLAMMAAATGSDWDDMWDHGMFGTR